MDKELVIWFMCCVTALGCVFFLSTCHQIDINVSCDAKDTECQEIIKDAYRNKK